MGMLGEFIEALGGPKAGPKGLQKIEQICSQLGWSIDGRIENGIVLNFKTPGGVREVMVVVGDSGTLGTASVVSAAEFTQQDAPEQFGYYLLLRNKDRPMGGWRMFKKDDRSMAFMFSHVFTVEGLTPGLFKVMCSNLAQEVGEMDVGLRAKGII